MFVCVLLLLCFASCTAQVFNVTSLDDFNKLVSEAKKGNFSFDVVLSTDIDALGISFPLGLGNGDECTPYSGTFDGGNHSISNAYTFNKLYNGLFCGLKNAVVKNLIISETCSFSGTTSAGGLAGTVSFNSEGIVFY